LVSGAPRYILGERIGLLTARPLCLGREVLHVVGIDHAPRQFIRILFLQGRPQLHCLRRGVVAHAEMGLSSRREASPAACPARIRRTSVERRALGCGSVSSEPCRISGLKDFRPLLRAVVDGEDHDAFFLDAISDDKGGVRNDQLAGAGYPA